MDPDLISTYAVSIELLQVMGFNIIYEESAADEIINLYPAIKFTSRTGVKTSPGL